MDSISNRIYLGLLGAISLWAFFSLFEYYEPDFTHGRAIVLFALSAIILSVFALHGPVSAFRAAILGAISGAIATAGFTFIILRFEDVNISEHYILLILAALALSWPFTIVRMQTGSFMRYHELHETAWTIAVRSLISGAFGWTFLGIIFLASALFQLVDLYFLEILLDDLPATAAMWGLGFGLAAAVTWEMQKLLSVLRFVIVMLLRLLTPIVLVILSIFVVRILFTSLNDTFRHISATGTMLTMIAVAVTLIAAGIEERGEETRFARFMDCCAVGLAIVSLGLIPFAIYGIWVRISDYGLTPERIFVVAAVVLATGYIVGYLLALMFNRRDWRTGFARVNIIVALFSIGIVALLSSPIINAERISSKAQLARFIAAPADFDMFSLNKINDWGQAGFDAIDSMRDEITDREGMEDIQDGLTLAAEGKHISRNTSNQNEITNRLETILELMPVYSDKDISNASVKQILSNEHDYSVFQIFNSCQTQTPSGLPRCAMIFDDRIPSYGNHHYVLLFTTADKSDGPIVVRWSHSDYNNIQLSGSFRRENHQGVFEALAAGQFSFEPVTYHRLQIDAASETAAPAVGAATAE